MSYALQGFRGFGAAAAPASKCGTSAVFNATTNNCECIPGTEWENESDPNNLNCKTFVCDGPNEAKSSIDQKCHCTPGFRSDDNDKCTLTGLSRWFPNCTDSSGSKVPGCLGGYPIKTIAPWAIGGAVVGLVLGAVLL